MRRHARVANLGWSDLVLLERDELTSGSTWHAAANGNTITADLTMMRMFKETFDLWRTLPEETGQDVGAHFVGGLMLAETEERMDELRRIHGLGRRLNLGHELLSPNEVKRFNPLVDTGGVLGAIFDPNGGHVDPYGLTIAYARGAQAKGAEIYRRTPVIELSPTADGAWRISTPEGALTADIIVNAAGFRANEIAGMTGAQLPMCAMQHHYVVTDAIDEVIDLAAEIPITRNPDGSWYLRREGQGLLLGIYEEASHSFGEDGIPHDFGQELLPEDLDRILPNFQDAMKRVPCLGEAGLKRSVNGPFCFTPDTRPLLGWMPGQRNHFCAAGYLAGLAFGGGFGRMAAEWIAEGRPSHDMTSCDVARFGDWANDGFALARAHDQYSHRYGIHFPYEEREAGRPVRTAPLYEAQKSRGAVFGAAYGWERPLWFAPEGMEPADIMTFRRPNWFDAVGDECKALRNGVGVQDIQTYARYEISGPQAEAFLDNVLANRMPRRQGTMRVTPMCDHAGGMVGDFTVTRLGDERFFLVGAGAFQGIHMRWFDHHRPTQGLVIDNVSDSRAGFSIAGPRSRELLTRVTNENVTGEALPFLRGREMTVAGVPVLVLRVAFSGDLGFEIHCALSDQARIDAAIRDAGRDLGLRDVGARALDSLRLEKGYGRIGYEYTPEVTPLEAGLEHLLALDGKAFIGRDALLRCREQGPRWRLVLLQVDAAGADAWANEPVFQAGGIVGSVSSGGYGHTVGKSLAMAFVRPDLSEPGAPLSVDILDDARPAIVLAAPPFDPKRERLRG